MTENRKQSCPNCGSPGVEKYCPACGQAAPQPKDYSIGPYAAELFESITSTDGKTLRTIARLLTRPGFLTAEHLAGRRARYLRPIQIFLLVNVLLFISAPQVPLFSYSLEKYLRYAPPSPSLVGRLVKKATPAGHSHVAGRGAEEFSEYAKAFDARVESQRKSLIILFAPALALLLLGMFRVMRGVDTARKRYGEHLVFSLHLLSFVWLVLAGVGLVARLSSVVGGVNRPALIFLITIVVGLLAWGLVYLVRGIRRVYATSLWQTAVAAVVVAGGFTGLLIAYRALLFFTTYYTL